MPHSEVHESCEPQLSSELLNQPDVWEQAKSVAVCSAVELGVTVVQRWYLLQDSEICVLGVSLELKDYSVAAESVVKFLPSDQAVQTLTGQTELTDLAEPVDTLGTQVCQEQA